MYVYSNLNSVLNTTTLWKHYYRTEEDGNSGTGTMWLYRMEQKVTPHSIFNKRNIVSSDFCPTVHILLRQFNHLKPSVFFTYHQFKIQKFHIVLALRWLFVRISEQTATCATYSINWLVFITEMKSVYSAVRTGSLNRAVCASYLKG